MRPTVFCNKIICTHCISQVNLLDHLRGTHSSQLSGHPCQVRIESEKTYILTWQGPCLFQIRFCFASLSLRLGVPWLIFAIFCTMIVTTVCIEFFQNVVVILVQYWHFWFQGASVWLPKEGFCDVLHDFCWWGSSITFGFLRTPKLYDFGAFQ